MNLPSSMPALVVREPGPSARLEVADLPLAQPGPDQVLVKVAFAGVNYIDQLLVQGIVPADPAARGVPGLEASGIVAALGERARGVALGDRVAWMGGLDAACYAPYAVIDAARVVPVPQALPLDAAACLPVAATTALHLIGLAGAGTAGRRTLVHAATGGVGVMLVQLLSKQGFEVIATTRNAGRTDFLRSLGAHQVLVPGADGGLGPAAHGVDVSFNAMGGDTVAQDIQRLAPYGQVVLYGLFAGPPGGVGESLVGAWGKSAAVRGADIFTQYVHRPGEFRAALVQGLALAAEGTLATPQAEVADLAHAGAALARLRSQGAQGKVLLRMP